MSLSGDRELIGITSEEAIILLSKIGISARIMSYEGEDFGASSEEPDSNRRNLIIKDGKVIDVVRG